MRALLLAVAAVLASLPAATAAGAPAAEAGATPDCYMIPYEGDQPFAIKEENACHYFCEGHVYDSGYWYGSCIPTGPARPKGPAPAPVGVRLLAA